MKPAVHESELTIVNPVAELSDLFEKMYREHEQLKEKLNKLYLRSRAVGANHRIHNWYAALTSLRKEVDQFVEDLEAHAEWEERQIFPLVCLHTGRSIGIFHIVEQEHEIAQLYLDDFLAEMDLVQKNYIGTVQAHDLASYLLQAYYILNEHFRKEEELVMPFIDKILEDTAVFYS